MSVRAEQFLEFAEPLAHSQEEIDRRNCASRAYYYALHLAARRASELGRPPFADATVQEGVIQRFKAWMGDNTGRKIGFLLTEMKQRRVLADYMIDENLSDVQTKAQLRTATSVREMLAALK